MAHDHGPGDKRLVAYLVAFPDAKPSAGELRTHLKEKLPDYMVPSVFMLLDKLPLNTNGKVDRRALPTPESSRPDLEQAFVEPRTALERVLVRNWIDVLGLERVGVNDNFFELGGHSLLATQLIARISEAFQTELPLRIIFECPSVSSMAERMQQTETRAGAFEEMASILEQIEALSDDEAKSMLEASNI